jgi:hypothetical protein
MIVISVMVANIAIFAQRSAPKIHVVLQYNIVNNEMSYACFAHAYRTVSGTGKHVGMTQKLWWQWELIPDIPVHRVIRPAFQIDPKRTRYTGRATVTGIGA